MPCIASESDAPLSAAALAMLDVDAVAWCTILNDQGELASRSQCIELGRILAIPVLVMGQETRCDPGEDERLAIDRRHPEAWPVSVASSALLRGDLSLSGWL
jgi:hypothetical protein